MKNAKLINVSGDVEDFADLIGTKGELHLIGSYSENNCFLPENMGDILDLKVKTIDQVSDDIVKVYTKLGNEFTFELI